MEVKTIRLRINNTKSYEEGLPEAIMEAERQVNDDGYSIVHRQVIVMPVPENGNRYFYTLWVEPIMVQPIGPTSFQSDASKRPPLT